MNQDELNANMAYLVNLLRSLSSEDELIDEQPKHLNKNQAKKWRKEQKIDVSEGILKDAITARKEGLEIPNEFTNYVIDCFATYFENKEKQDSKTITLEKVFCISGKKSDRTKEYLGLYFMVSRFVEGFQTAEAHINKGTAAAITKTKRSIKFNFKELMSNQQPSYEFGYVTRYSSDSLKLNQKIIIDFLSSALPISRELATQKVLFYKLDSVLSNVHKNLPSLFEYEEQS